MRYRGPHFTRSLRRFLHPLPKTVSCVLLRQKAKSFVLGTLIILAPKCIVYDANQKYNSILGWVKTYAVTKQTFGLAAVKHSHYKCSYNRTFNLLKQISHRITTGLYSKGFLLYYLMAAKCWHFTCECQLMMFHHVSYDNFDEFKDNISTTIIIYLCLNNSSQLNCS